MLIEFRVANFRSFLDEQVLSMVASDDKTHRGNSIASSGRDYLKAAAVYGANASGKSNLIRAFRFVQSFVTSSATRMNVGDKIDVVPFRLNAESHHRPSRFELSLILNNVRHRYGFTVTRDRVHEEWLVAYPEGRAQRWFERRFDPDSQQTIWTFRGAMKRQRDILIEKTRDNGLVLSRGAELNIAQIVPLFQWFRDDLQVHDLSAGTSDVFLLQNQTAERVMQQEDFRSSILRFLSDADLGVDGIRVTQRPEQANAVAKAVIQLVEIVGKSFFETSFPQIQSIHKGSDSGEEVLFDFDDESNGTRRFFALAGLWLGSLEKGRVLVIDELDCSMHPTMTRMLIRYFQGVEQNKSGAQLVFATHDTSLMDQALFRRDQIWLVEKNADQASRLFSLYDFAEKPRKSEALEKRYLAGRYGGVPILGPSLESLDLR